MIVKIVIFCIQSMTVIKMSYYIEKKNIFIETSF